MKHFVSFVFAFFLAAVALFGAGWLYLGPVGDTQPAVFTVPEQSADFDVPRALSDAKLVKSEKAFRILYNMTVSGGTTPPGGYRLDGNMNAWDIIRKLTALPDFVWVRVREGLRREQVGILLHDKLAWTDSQETAWNQVFAENPEYREGVYFPDTYLLPRDESVQQIAQRFIDRFNEKFASYTDEFLSMNVKWTTAIKIASLIQREAGGAADMPIISGVIWNRLDKHMRLQIDATIQYALGKGPDSWWPVIKGSDTRLTESPYNSYLHEGLPPTPIANPGLAAIDAAAHPAETDCLYYLHDHSRQIHCAKTYEEHVENIKAYLQ